MPEDDVIAMDELQRNEASYEAIGGQESLELGRRAQEVVRPQLGDAT